MGAWDIGPFDNDMAADFAGALDRAPAARRVELVRAALLNAIAAPDYLDVDDGAQAVAAATLVAAQCPGGEPVVSGYAPKQEVPAFPAELRILAAKALDRVVADDSELAEGWGDTSPWRAGIDRLRHTLVPSR